MADDKRTDHPAFGDFLSALARDFDAALEGAPGVTAELDLELNARVWGQKPDSGASTGLVDILIDFNEPGEKGRFTIKLRPSAVRQAQAEELAREKVTRLQEQFVKDLSAEAPGK